MAQYLNDNSSNCKNVAESRYKLYMTVEVKSTYCPGKSYLTEVKQYICWRPTARKKLKGKVDKTLYFIKSLAT